MAWVLPPPKPASKSRTGLMGFVPVKWLSVSFRSCFSVVVGCVAWKNVSGVLYGGLAVPSAIVCRSRASSAWRYFPSMMSCFGMQACGFQIGVRVCLVGMVVSRRCERVIILNCDWIN